MNAPMCGKVSCQTWQLFWICLNPSVNRGTDKRISQIQGYTMQYRIELYYHVGHDASFTSWLGRICAFGSAVSWYRFMLQNHRHGEVFQLHSLFECNSTPAGHPVKSMWIAIAWKQTAHSNIPYYKLWPLYIELKCQVACVIVLFRT